MKRILIADDDKLLRDGLAKVLATHGYEIDQASNGEEAYSLAEAKNPDLIITDILMPKLSGLEMLGKVRHTVWGEHIPVIVLTIKDQDIEDVNKTMQIGTGAYLSKSEVSPDDVAKLVDQYLQDNT
jgi:twitching motility two-component system response regulator PilH